jgi:hypothetical protein
MEKFRHTVKRLDKLALEKTAAHNGKVIGPNAISVQLSDCSESLPGLAKASAIQPPDAMLCNP